MSLYALLQQFKDSEMSTPSPPCRFLSSRAINYNLQLDIGQYLATLLVKAQINKTCFKQVL
jgi:hypothetical protein